MTIGNLIEFDLKKTLFNIDSKVKKKNIYSFSEEEVSFQKENCNDKTRVNQFAEAMDRFTESGKVLGKKFIGKLNIPKLHWGEKDRSKNYQGIHNDTYVQIISRENTRQQKDFSNEGENSNISTNTEVDVLTSAINNTTPFNRGGDTDFTVAGNGLTATAVRISGTLVKIFGEHRSKFWRNSKGGTAIRDSQGRKHKTIDGKKIYSTEKGYIGNGGDVKRDFETEKKHVEKRFLMAQQSHDIETGKALYPSLNEEDKQRFKDNQAVKFLFEQTTTNTLDRMMNSEDKRHMVMEDLIKSGMGIPDEELKSLGIAGGQSTFTNLYGQLFEGDDALYDRKDSNSRRKSSNILVQDRIKTDSKGNKTVEAEKLLSREFFEPYPAEGDEAPMPTIRKDIISALFRQNQKSRLENLNKKPPDSSPNTLGIRWHHGHRQEIANEYLYTRDTSYRVMAQGGKMHFEENSSYRINQDLIATQIDAHDIVHNKQMESQLSRLIPSLNENNGFEGQIDSNTEGFKDYEGQTHKMEGEQEVVQFRPLTVSLKTKITGEDGTVLTNEAGEYVGDAETSVGLDNVSQQNWDSGLDDDGNWDFDKWSSSLSPEDKKKFNKQSGINI